MLECVVVLIVGCLVGVAVGLYLGIRLMKKRFEEKDVGKLIVETSDPDGPFLFLELHKDVREVMVKKSVVLTVDNSGLINSQE